VGPLVRSLVWVLTSSVVEVPGVVEGVDEPTCDEFRVEAEARWARPFLFCLSAPFACLSSVLVMRLLFLPKLLRNEGMVSTAALVYWTDYGNMGEGSERREKSDVELLGAVAEDA